MKLLKNLLKKRTPLHLFLILFGILLLYCVSTNITEGLTDKSGKTKSKTKDGLAQGVPSGQIPEGNENMYILKSEIVPPVCPACPITTSCPRQKPCRPCPPCARCPEPAFECKKVPNYKTNDDRYLPRPVLSDFSQFGM